MSYRWVSGADLSSDSCRFWVTACVITRRSFIKPRCCKVVALLHTFGDRCCCSRRCTSITASSGRSLNFWSDWWAAAASSEWCCPWDFINECHVMTARQRLCGCRHLQEAGVWASQWWRLQKKMHDGVTHVLVLNLPFDRFSWRTFTVGKKVNLS